MAEAGLSSSGLTRENIVYDKDGNAYIPATQRPDGTWRKAIKVKPGYIPQEEVPVYQSKGKAFAQSVLKASPGADNVEAFDRDVVEEKPLTKAQKKNLHKKQKRKEQKASQVAFVIEEVTFAMDKVSVQDSEASKITSAIQDRGVSSTSAGIEELKQDHQDVQQKDTLKKVRTLRKKLKQIEDLEKRIASGDITKPDSDQLNKIAKKEEFLVELETLEEEEVGLGFLQDVIHSSSLKKITRRYYKDADRVMRCLTHCCWIPFSKYLHRFSWKNFYSVFIKYGTDNPVREIWRLRLNFFVIMILSFLGGIGYTSTLASFHQYITNPRKEELNGTDYHKMIVPGLGKSEFFYSWMITVYSIGEVILAPVAGYSAKWIPYWYLLLVGIISHTFGYLLYAVASNGWIMLLSRFLAGAYSGIIETVGYAYISEKEADYLTSYAKKKSLYHAKKRYKAPKVKEKTYAFLTVTITLSYLAGPGMSALIAQFPAVDQFRWVGWFNVVLGLMSIVLLIIFFHGEYHSACCNRGQTSKADKTSDSFWKHLQITKASCLRISLLSFFLVSSYVMDSSYGVVDTLFNPILSDIYGFTEKEISYFFVGVMLVYVVGSLVLVLLNTVSFSSRLVAILAVIASMIGVGLIADWQSVGYDPCIKYSVFHNPELKHNVTPLINELNLTTSKIVALPNSALFDSSNCLQFDFKDGLDQLRTQQKEHVIGSGGSSLGSGHSSPHVPLECTYVINHEDSPCRSCSSLQSDTQVSLACMSFRLNLKSSCYEMVTEHNTTADDLNSNMTALLCEARGYPLSVCVNVQNVRFFSDVEIQDFKEATSILTSSVVSNPHLYPGFIADIQESTEVVELDPDVITAKSICLESEDNCYWNQYSQVTKEECYSCPQICRSVKKSLNFVQFSLGAAIFVIAIPISRVVLMILISDNLSQENQAPFTGIVVAAGGVARTVSPLWIDAAYEFVQKRTFFVMTIKLMTFAPILIGLLLFYKVLKKPNQESSPIPSSAEEEEDSELEDNNVELKQLVVDKQDS